MAERSILSRSMVWWAPTGRMTGQVRTRSFKGAVVAGPDTTVGSMTAEGLNQVATVTVSGAGAGTFTLSYAGQTTGGLAYNANSATVEAALEGLSTIGTGNVSVVNPSTGRWNVTFQGSLAGQPLTALTADGSSLTPANEIQLVTLPTGLTGGTFTLTFGANTTATTVYNAAASLVQTRLQAIASIGSGNATVAGSDGGPYTVTFVSGKAATPLALLMGNPASLVPAAGPPIVVTEVQRGSAAATVAVVVTQTGSTAGSSVVVGTAFPPMVQTRLQASQPTTAKPQGAFAAVRTGTVTVPVATTTSEERTRRYWNGRRGFSNARQLSPTWK